MTDDEKKQFNDINNRLNVLNQKLAFEEDSKTSAALYSEIMDITIDNYDLLKDGAKEYDYPDLKTVLNLVEELIDLKEKNDKLDQEIKDKKQQLAEKDKVLQQLNASLTTKNQQLPAIDSIFNGAIVSVFFKFISGYRPGLEEKEHSGQGYTTKWSYSKDNTKLQFIKTGKKEEYTIEFERLETKQPARINKILLYAYQEINRQHVLAYLGENKQAAVTFNLQNLVDLKMYESKKAARLAINNFYMSQTNFKVGGVKIGKNSKQPDYQCGKSIMFSSYSIDNSIVTLWLAPGFPWAMFTEYYSVFPRFAYGLKENAFSLIYCIFYLARQNTKDIKGKGTFTIKLETVSDYLGLPTPDDVKGRKYNEYIKKPIDDAITEIETVTKDLPEAQNYGLTITPHYIDNGKISDWLKGYLTIGLAGDFAKTFIGIATKQETRIKKIEAAKLKRIATQGIAPQNKPK